MHSCSRSVVGQVRHDHFRASRPDARCRRNGHHRLCNRMLGANAMSITFFQSGDGPGIQQPRSIEQGRARDRAMCPAVTRVMTAPRQALLRIQSSLTGRATGAGSPDPEIYLGFLTRADLEALRWGLFTMSICGLPALIVTLFCRYGG